MLMVICEKERREHLSLLTYVVTDMEKPSKDWNTLGGRRLKIQTFCKYA